MICFFFSAKCEICNFADDNSLYSCGMNLDNIFFNLIQDGKGIWMICIWKTYVNDVYEWSGYHSMNANPDKFQFIILGNTDSHTLKIRFITIKLASSVTLLGITIDS